MTSGQRQGSFGKGLELASHEPIVVTAQSQFRNYVFADDSAFSWPRLLELKIDLMPDEEPLRPVDVVAGDHLQLFACHSLSPKCDSGYCFEHLYTEASAAGTCLVKYNSWASNCPRLRVSHA